ncbi:MAG: hypothetical protein NUV76_05375 [Candidatus Kuenenia sp.]|nr:hypothetical protein [Candidatus Kuenenia sp.]
MKLKKKIILQSVITCPNCGHQKEETMPTDARQLQFVENKGALA